MCSLEQRRGLSGFHAVLERALHERFARAPDLSTDVALQPLRLPAQQL